MPDRQRSDSIGATMEAMQTHRRTPRVVAHRGSSAAKAEHTLGAYLQALQDGADGLECDVRMTLDGHLVCVHDRRVDRTTNARGAVSTMTLADLDQLDASFWKDPLHELDDQVDFVDPEHTKVLSLRRLLEAVRDHDRHIELAIETKHPTRYAGMVEERLVELLDEFGLVGPASPVKVLSKSGLALSRIERLAPDLEVVFVIEGLVTWKMTRSLLSSTWIAGPSIDELRERPRFGRRLVAQGRRLFVWTVNTPEDLDICLDLGAEAVITDRPDMVRTLLDSA